MERLAAKHKALALAASMRPAMRSMPAVAFAAGAEERGLAERVAGAHLADELAVLEELDFPLPHGEEAIGVVAFRADP